MSTGQVVVSSGTKLYKGTNPLTGVELPDILEYPNILEFPDEKDTTALADLQETKRPGIKKLGGMEFRALFTGMKVDGDDGTTWVALKTVQDSGEPEDFCIEYPDGSGFTWNAYVALQLNGKGNDENMEFSFKMFCTGPILQLVDTTPALLTFACADGATAGTTKIATVSPTLTGGNAYMYKVNGQLPYVGEDLTDSEWADYTLDADIPVVNGNYITLAEVDSGDLVVKAGRAVAVVV